jgi:hypothetical protein
MIYNLIKQQIREKKEEIMNLEEELESYKRVIYTKIVCINL